MLNPRAWLPVFLLLTIASGYVRLGWNQDIGESGSDGPAYLMMAEHYAGHGRAGPAHDLAATTSRFPPVYPLLLALAGGASDLLRAHLLTMLCLLAALAALYAWLRVQRLPTTASSLFVLSIALAPGSWLLSLILQSEYLYLFWSALALTLMAAGERRQSEQIFYLAALAVASAALTRTVGIVLVAPLMLSLRQLPRKKALLSLGVAVLPILLWKLVHHSRMGYDEAVIGLYHETGLSGFFQRLPAQWQGMRVGVEENLIRHAVLQPLADVLGLLAATAALARAARLRPDACYLLIYAVVILLWPFAEEGRRFVWVILPILLAQPLLLLAENGATTDKAAGLVAGVWLLLIAVPEVPGAVYGLQRWREAGREDLVEARQYAMWYAIDTTGVRRQIERDMALKDAMRAVAGTVPKDDCVFSTRPDLVIYYGQRVSILPPAETVPEPAFRQILGRIGCRYVFGLFGVNALYPTPLYPVARVEAFSDPLFLSSLPGSRPGSGEDVAALVRLK